MTNDESFFGTPVLRKKKISFCGACKLFEKSFLKKRIARSSKIFNAHSHSIADCIFLKWCEVPVVLYPGTSSILAVFVGCSHDFVRVVLKHFWRSFELLPRPVEGSVHALTISDTIFVAYWIFESVWNKKAIFML